MLKVYAYKGCSTCKAALKWLQENGVAFEELPIRETPPTVAELQRLLQAKGELRLLFNTSGQDYRAMAMKEKLPGMTTAAALELLAQNGNLVKRPFAVDEEKGICLNGFKPEEWRSVLN